MRLFDAYVFVDWSARNHPSPPKPSENAIWVGRVTSGGRPEEEYCRTRDEAVSYVKSLLLTYTKCRSRVLVGFDFPYGYPSGFARAIGLPRGSGWWEIWTGLTDRIKDNQDNHSNRFEVAAELNRLAGNGREGPLWGCPAGRTIPGLQPKSPGFHFPAAQSITLQRLRIVEKQLPGVQEAWKLFGAGSVGSQALVGIPRVCNLRRDPALAHFSRVWPFERGFNEKPSQDKVPLVLHTEIWPGMVRTETDQMIDANPFLIRDRAQVRAMCVWAAREDDQGNLGRFFARPAGLTDEEVDICITEEGWVLGAV